MRNPLKIFRSVGIFSAFLLFGAFFTPLKVFAWGFTDAVGNTVLAGISLFILTFASMLLGIFGTFFNWVVIRTVFQFGTYFGTTDGMLIAWGVMRDIANIGLLFGFIFMGVMLILNVSGGHGGGMDAKRAIPRLILFAVLLNFSLFASQGIIDVANALGSQFAGLAGLECGLEDTGKECANRGISGRVMQMAGITSIWNQGLLDDQSGLTLLALALFVTITAMVLLAAAIMLVVRVVILTLLMVTSPIGFAGMVIPGLGGLASKWWHMLISQAFFAPVMLLLMFISLRMADSMNPKGSSIVQALGGLGTDVQGGIGGAGDLEILVVFAVVIGLMLASLMAASKMGAMGAKFATNSAAALTFGTMTRATNYGAGRAARAGRNYMQKSGTAALGRVGGRIGGIAGARGAALGEKLGSGTGKVLVNRALTPLEKANLDARRVPGVGGLLGLAGIDTGAKPAEHVSFAEMEHKYEDFRDGKQGKVLDQQYERQVSGKQLAQEAHDVDEKKKTDSTVRLSDKSEQFLNSLSVKEIAALHEIKAGSEAAWQALTPEKFAQLSDGDELTDAEKDAGKAARFKELDSVLKTGSPEEIKKLLKGITKAEKELIPAKFYESGKLVDGYSDSDRKALEDSKKLTRTTRELVKGSYSHARINAAYESGGAPAVLAFGGPTVLTSLKNEQILEVDSKVLADPALASHFAPQMLKALQRSKELTADKMKTIGSNIRAGSMSPEMQTFMDSKDGQYYWT